jgi:MFS family permease
LRDGWIHVRQDLADEAGQDDSAAGDWVTAHRLNKPFSVACTHRHPLKGGFSGRAAGFLLSWNWSSSASTTLFLSAFFSVHSTRTWAVFGGFLTILGATLTLVFPLLPVFLAARLIAGIGAGVVGAQATSVLSRGIEREKLIATVTIVSILNAAIWLSVLPYMIDKLGYRGPYVCLLLISLSGTYPLRRLPSLSSPRRTKQASTSSESSQSPSLSLPCLSSRRSS